MDCIRSCHQPQPQSPTYPDGCLGDVHREVANDDLDRIGAGYPMRSNSGSARDVGRVAVPGASRRTACRPAAPTSLGLGRRDDLDQPERRRASLPLREACRYPLYIGAVNVQTQSVVEQRGDGGA